MKVFGRWPLDADAPGFLHEGEIEFEGETMVFHVVNNRGESYASTRMPIREVELLIETHRRATK